MALSPEEKKQILELYEKLFNEAKQLNIDFKTFQRQVQEHIDKQKLKEVLEHIVDH